MPYIAMYSANNGPVQYVDSNNKVNFVGYAQSAEDLTSAFYIRSTINLAKYNDHVLPDSGYYGSRFINEACYGCLFVSLAQTPSSNMLKNTILSSVNTFQDYVDVLWYEDTGTDFSATPNYPQNYFLTKIGDIPSALARGYVNTADCSLCTCSSFYASTAYFSTEKANVGIVCFPPSTATAGYFVCVKKRDFDTTNMKFNTVLSNRETLSALSPYNRLLALNLEYNCNSATNASYMYYDCKNYSTIQNVVIPYGNVPSDKSKQGYLTTILTSPAYEQGRPDMPISATVQPTRVLKNIDLETNIKERATAYHYSAYPVGIISPMNYMYWSANYDVVDNVNAYIEQNSEVYMHDHRYITHIRNASNLTHEYALTGKLLSKVIYNCKDVNNYTNIIEKDCAVIKSNVLDGASTHAECDVNYKLIDSSAYYRNPAEYAASAVNSVNFNNDIINSYITATQIR